MPEGQDLVQGPSFADPKSEIFSNSKFLNNKHRDAQLLQAEFPEVTF